MISSLSTNMDAQVVNISDASGANVSSAGNGDRRGEKMLKEEQSVVQYSALQLPLISSLVIFGVRSAIKSSDVDGIPWSPPTSRARRLGEYFIQIRLLP
jgi:hypothetical protein